MKIRTSLTAALSAVALTGSVLSTAPTALAATPTPAPPATLDRAAQPTPATAYTPPAQANTTVTGSVPTGGWAPTVQQTAQPKSGRTAATSGATPNATVAPQSVPAGTPVGTPGLGLQPYFGTEAFPLAEDLTATVNLANGNLVVRTTDVSVNAPGLSLQLDRFYNGLSAGTGAFGKAGVLSTGRDVGLAVTSTTVTFSGPSGFSAAFTPTSGGKYTAPAGINADLVKNADATFTLTYRKSAEKLSFTAGGFLTFDVDRNGVGLALAYRADNTLASITDGAGRVTTVTYTNGRISQISDPATRNTSYGYDAAGNLISVTNPAGKLTSYTYDSTGRLATLKAPGGNVTAFGYDTSSRVTTVSRYTTKGASSGDAATTTFAYPSATSTTETNPLGKTAAYTLDSSGRVTKTTDALNRVRSTTWTANSDIATATDAMGTGGTGGNVTTYAYDTNNSLTAVTTPTGAATNLKYTGTSGTSCASTDTTHPYQPKCATDAQGKTQTLSYDTPGNVTKAQDTTATGGIATTSTYQRPAAATTGTTCGAKPGQLCSSTDGKGATTSNTYNSLGQITTVTPPAPLPATTYTYDSLSRVISSTNGRSQTIGYTYDVRDHLVQTTYSDGGATTYSFDADGNKTQLQDGDLTPDVYTYDALGRQTSTSSPAPGPQGALTATYDKAGNITTFVDRTGTVTYTYDAANQLVALAEPGGSCPTSGAGTKCTRFGYDMNGSRTSTTYPGGVVQTATVDASARITRILAQKPGGPVISDLSYSYAGTGTGAAADRSLLQKKTTTTTVAGAPSGAVTTYGYDNLSRLTAATEKTSTGAASAAWTYGYDASGNRTSQSTVADGVTEPATFTYNAADQITAINGETGLVTYDGSGNELTFPDIVGGPVRQPSPSRTVGYTDTNQAVITSTSGGANISYNYRGPNQDLRTSNDTASFQTGVLGVSNQYDGTTLTGFTRDANGTLISQRVGTTSSYYLTDNQGSIIGLVDGTGTKIAGYAYDPFGTTRTINGDLTTANANPYRYTGGYRDANTGLYNLGYRYYDTLQGRFTQQDPSGQEANNYSYAGANPVNATDPTGQFSFTSALGSLAFSAQGGITCVAAGLATVEFGGIGGALCGVGVAVGASIIAGATG